MGTIYSITCRNKECRYHVELRDGPGMGLFRKTGQLEEQILESRDAPDAILRLLDEGHHLDCVTSYLCPVCKVWHNDNQPYIREVICISPLGTIREYKMHYLNGTPRCPECNTELIHILNPLSGKNKCPKCGADNMKCNVSGFYD